MEDQSSEFALDWQLQIGEREIRCHGDFEKRVDNSATLIALELMRKTSGRNAVDVAYKGSRVDYFLSDPGDDALIFNGAVRLEVTGIDDETDGNTVEKRMEVKKRILKKPGGPGHDRKTCVCVVEFSTPKSLLELV
jgi:hypothetical protein